MGAVAIPLRVVKLVPVLGSPSEGEALGACRAIGRTLRGAGQDFHALAAAIRTSGSATAQAAPRTEPWMRPAPAYRPSRSQPWTFTPRQSAEHKRIAQRCLAADCGRLRSRERDFLESVIASRRELTIAQLDWLNDIALSLEEVAS